MSTISADTLPDALSAPAREFIAEPHRLLIGSERPEAADGRTPFGGSKASGIGREHGHDGLDAHLEAKTVWTAL